MNSQDWQEAIAAIPIALMVLDADERIVAANQTARGLFGAAVEDRLGAAVLRHPAFLAALSRVLAEGVAVEARATLPGKSEEGGLRVQISPVRIQGRRGALAAFEDMSGMEQAEAIRRDFVANVSHELRTPLTALVGFIETLKGPARDDAPARDRFLSVMESEAGRMMRLVNDLLSLSRVQSEERRLPSETVEILALLRRATMAQAALADAAGVSLEIETDLPEAQVRGDSDQLTQVFLNLIENAVKYGGAGKVVTLKVSQVAREPVLKGPAVQIEVIDRGEGIDAIHLPRLTERFYRVDTHRSRSQGGTGLGLAIVKHIINRHRGRFRITSERGKGSNFIVILPSVSG
ncbi:ATP-binding protein [Albidovulum sediminicola]|uniref:histidine kinase n=1 Tax=Albidovulum sediminicola TaxID=2984331 RepID=A0ABT2Z3L2_9RHOB|nr:ATP-binding protein [Defluviimonas sp. WL0075]MCV2865692.1 ATP-binding protein [Defluviimonas sp. WL0075]